MLEHVCWKFHPLLEISSWKTFGHLPFKMVLCEAQWCVTISHGKKGEKQMCIMTFNMVPICWNGHVVKSMTRCCSPSLFNSVYRYSYNIWIIIYYIYIIYYTNLLLARVHSVQNTAQKYWLSLNLSPPPKKTRMFCRKLFWHPERKMTTFCLDRSCWILPTWKNLTSHYL